MSAALHSCSEDLIVRCVFIKIPLHPWMNDQFLQRIFLINSHQTLPFLWMLHANSRLNRYIQRTACEYLLQKCIQFLRHCEKSRPAMLCYHGSRRTAQVQIHGMISILCQHFRNAQKILRPVCQNLRHHLHPGIMLRQDIVYFFMIQIPVRKKWGKIFINIMKMSMVCVPIDISCQALHGRHVKLHLSCSPLTSLSPNLT